MNQIQLTQAFSDLRALVKQPTNYVPRDYQTIGGMWTVEKYQLGDVVLAIMDEGYTTQISIGNVIAISDYSGHIRVISGTLDEFVTAAEQNLENTDGT
jgi:hypothetical protein